MKTNPIIWDNGKSIQLKKIQFDENEFDENWIQERIHENSKLLPIKDIEPIFDNAISIGREIPINSKYIDNLFINADGYVTIVETKLWRNPEARREVVGQIIEYAKELNKWNFQQFNNSIKRCNSNEGIIEILNKNNDIPIDETVLIDNCSFPQY